MANYKKSINIFIISILALILGCSQALQSDQVKKTEEVCLNTNSKFTFNYWLLDTTSFGDHQLINAKFKLLNNSADSVFYIAQSCNDLEYFITFKSDSFKISPSINCDATWPRTRFISPHDSLIFNTNILQLKNSPNLNCLGLYLIKVEELIHNDSIEANKEVMEMYKERTDSSKIIWGIKKLAITHR